MKHYKIDLLHEDDRGQINNILPADAVIKTALYITGSKGAIRGSHTHKKDEHYCLVLGGKIEYRYIEKGKSEYKSLMLEAGDVIYSEAGEWHQFCFQTEGIFIAFATLARTHKNYENDTTREQF